MHHLANRRIFVEFCECRRYRFINITVYIVYVIIQIYKVLKSHIVNEIKVIVEYFSILNSAELVIDLMDAYVLRVL